MSAPAAFSSPAQRSGDEPVFAGPPVAAGDTVAAEADSFTAASVAQRSGDEPVFAGPPVAAGDAVAAEADCFTAASVAIGNLLQERGGAERLAQLLADGDAGRAAGIAVSAAVRADMVDATKRRLLLDTFVGMKPGKPSAGLLTELLRALCEPVPGLSLCGALNSQRDRGDGANFGLRLYAEASVVYDDFARRAGIVELPVELPKSFPRRSELGVDRIFIAAASPAIVLATMIEDLAVDRIFELFMCTAAYPDDPGALRFGALCYQDLGDKSHQGPYSRTPGTFLSSLSLGMHSYNGQDMGLVTVGGCCGGSGRLSLVSAEAVSTVGPGCEAPAGAPSMARPKAPSTERGTQGAPRRPRGRQARRGRRAWHVPRRRARPSA